MSPLPRVLSYPPVHDYVDRLHDVAAVLVHRDQPWPRLANLYDPSWVEAHAGDWDVVHFHFTWEQYPPETMADVLTAHRRSGAPVVWTAHDLRNPQLPDDGSETEYLELLAEAAAVVVALTPGAAAQVAECFGRIARVVPHGPLVPPDVAAGLRRAHARSGSTLRLFLLAKDLRANLDWRTPLEVVRELTADGGGAVHLDVHLHPDAVDRAEIEAFGEMSSVSVRTGARLTTPQLWKRIAATDVLLLPYRWGTHSGLLELAADVGTQPLVTDVGFLAQQAPCHVVGTRSGAVDAEELGAVLRRLAAGDGSLDPVPTALREGDLAAFHRAHASLYEELVSARGTAVGR